MKQHVEKECGGNGCKGINWTVRLLVNMELKKLIGEDNLEKTWPKFIFFFYVQIMNFFFFLLICHFLIGPQK